MIDIALNGEGYKFKDSRPADLKQSKYEENHPQAYHSQITENKDKKILESSQRKSDKLHTGENNLNEY